MPVVTRKKTLRSSTTASATVKTAASKTRSAKTRLPLTASEKNKPEAKSKKAVRAPQTVKDKGVKPIPVVESIPVVRKLTVKPGKIATVYNSELRYTGPLFRVYSEEIESPKGHRNTRDIVRHNGSVVILAVDSSTSKRDPLIVIERQYRHAAQQYLYEVPAGKMEPNEERLAAAKRELLEETGYKARKWSKLVRYYASPGFLGEWMQVFLAEDLIPGKAHPEDYESLELMRVPLSELLRLIERGQIQDGKTLISVLSYARTIGKK